MRVRLAIIIISIFVSFILCTCSVCFLTHKIINGNPGNNKEINSVGKVEQSLEYKLSDDGSYYIVVGPGTYVEKDVVVPSIYKGKPVKGIESSGDVNFKDFGIKSIRMPDSIEYIGYGAFEDCDTLRQVDFGNGLKIIEDCAFYNCDNLLTLVLPDSLKRIEYWAFGSCKGLVQVTLGANIEYIYSSEDEEGVFDECYRLVEVINNSDLVIEKGNYEANGCLGYYALSVSNKNPDYVSKLTIDENGFIVYNDGEDKILVSYCGEEQKAVIPNYINKINRNAFYRNDNVLSIVVSDSIEEIGSSAFASTKYLIEVINESSLTIDEPGNTADYKILNKKDDNTSTFTTDNDGFIIYDDGVEKFLVKYIGKERNVIIPEGIKYIHQYAFYENKTMLTVTIPNTIKKIGRYAFCDCLSLTSIVLGSGVEEINYRAFNGCYKLVEVINKSNLQIPQDGDEYDYKNYGDLGMYAYYISNKEDDYVSRISIEEEKFIVYYDGIKKTIMQYIANDENLIISENYNAIHHSCFSESSKIKTITINMQNINRQSFYSTKVEKLILGDNVENIEEQAFYGCENLVNVTIGKNVKEIGGEAFYGCEKLVNVTIGKSVKEIGRCAFFNCKSLTSIIIPASVELIGEESDDDDYYAAFGEDNMYDEECYNLTNVIFEDPKGWYSHEYNDDEEEKVWVDIDSDLSDAEIAAKFIKNRVMKKKI